MSDTHQDIIFDREAFREYTKFFVDLWNLTRREDLFTQIADAIENRDSSTVKSLVTNAITEGVANWSSVIAKMIPEYSGVDHFTHKAYMDDFHAYMEKLNKFEQLLKGWNNLQFSGRSVGINRFLRTHNAGLLDDEHLAELVMVIRPSGPVPA